MTPGAALFCFFALPALVGFLALLAPTSRSALFMAPAGVIAALPFGVVLIRAGAASERLFAGGWLMVDPLSAIHLLVLLGVFVLCSFYAPPYFLNGTHGPLDRRSARLFSALFLASLVCMSLTLLSNNLGLMWVGIETTTLSTAFLIYIPPSRPALEAMWKYILICSVGVALAFMGILFTAAGAGDALPHHQTMLWTELRGQARLLDPALMKTAFIFILVGYGTKAGLAPLHTWLPDAHSQAPSPVSALFSGFMLNASLYCILRYLPLMDGPLSAWSLGLLRGFGLLSVIVAAAFIIFQRDLKRLLAYSSIEHLGIMSLGVSFGPAGAFAALYHMTGHALAKCAAFFSAGRLGQHFGSHALTALSGASRTAPAFAACLFTCLLALTGAAPFSPFLSEFLVAQSALSAGHPWSLAVLLAAIGVIFIAVLSAAIPLYWGSDEKERPVQSVSRLETLLAFAPLVPLLVLGLHMPAPFKNLLFAAAAVVNGQTPGVLP